MLNTLETSIASTNCKTANNPIEDAEGFKTFVGFPARQGVIKTFYKDKGEKIWIMEHCVLTI